MERLNGVLLENIELNKRQRVIAAENELLSQSRHPSVPRMQVRFHHFRIWADFAYGFVTGRNFYDKPKMPWNYGDLEIFSERAKLYAIKSAISDLSGYEDDYRYAQSLGNDDVSYYRDLIGDTQKERQGYLTSRYLTNLNFLLRANRNPDQATVLSYDNDGICNSCRGLSEGAGDHCSNSERPGDDSIREAFVKIRKLMVRQKCHNLVSISKTGSEFFVPIKLFFNRNFSNLLDGVELGFQEEKDLLEIS